MSSILRTGVNESVTVLCMSRSASEVHVVSPKLQDKMKRFLGVSLDF